ncbi:MAG: flagellar export protein FliJ [Spirochaetes bacterium]|nr:flagellar export protein FliJ [Spirochaetota bacterium]
MKRFNFSLQKILQLRKYREEECKIQLGVAIGALSQIEDNIQLTASKRSFAASERFSAVGGSAGGGDFLAWEVYINRLDLERVILEEDAAAAAAVVEEKRGIYLEAARDLKTMEKLKEKKEKEHRKEMLAAETLELDLQAHAKRFFTV